MKLEKNKKGSVKIKDLPTERLLECSVRTRQLGIFRNIIGIVKKGKQQKHFCGLGEGTEVINWDCLVTVIGLGVLERFPRRDRLHD